MNMTVVELRGFHSWSDDAAGFTDSDIGGPQRQQKAPFVICPCVVLCNLSQINFSTVLLPTVVQFYL
jgi:hypothetical protein